MNWRQKILGWPRLKQQIEQHRRAGKQIVFTNGCFDLVHVGHLRVFEWSKKQGDVLIVALNSDASIRRLKGPKRPIMKFGERSQLLAALEMVDFVTSFNEDTPRRLIEMLKPDVLVKGGDWKAADIVGADLVGKVVRVPVVKGKSTTGVIERVLKVYGSPKKTC